MIGLQIEHYRIDAKLGDGGMGVVYRAMDLELERTVALKFLHQELANSPDLLTRFRAEARAQAKLNHHNIATLYDFFIWQGTAVMAMEFVDGETLHEMILRRGPVPAQISVPLFRQALHGVAAAHRQEIIHRDLKPANLMLNRDGVVKVMDFGIAKVQSSNGMTRTNAVMGTSWYMAPEQIRNRPIDARTDIYSMGVTLYELVAGQVPFCAESEYEIQSAHVQLVPDRPTVHYPHIPENVVRAVMKALAKDPADRFQTVPEFLDALPEIVVRPEATSAPPTVHEIRVSVRAAKGLAAAQAPQKPCRLSGISSSPPQVKAPAHAEQVAQEPPPSGTKPSLPQRTVSKPENRSNSSPTIVQKYRFIQNLTSGNSLRIAFTGGGALALALGVAWLVHRPPLVPVSELTSVAREQLNSGSQTAPLDLNPGERHPDPEPELGRAAITVQPGERINPEKVPTAAPKVSPVETREANVSAAPMTTGQGLSGIWSGAYSDAASIEKTTVTIRMRETSPDRFNGTVDFRATTGASGTCQLGPTTYDPAKRQLLLSIALCTGAQHPAYFNVPTRFSNVDPSADTLNRGEVLYLRTDVAATLSKN